MNYFSMAVKIIIAIPKIKEAFETLMAMYEHYMISEMEKEQTDLDKRRAVLVRAISKAGSKDDRKELSIILHEYASGKLHDSERPI